MHLKKIKKIKNKNPYTQTKQDQKVVVFKYYPNETPPTIFGEVAQLPECWKRDSLARYTLFFLCVLPYFVLFFFLFSLNVWCNIDLQVVWWTLPLHGTTNLLLLFVIQEVLLYYKHKIVTGFFFLFFWFFFCRCLWDCIHKNKAKIKIKMKTDRFKQNMWN